MMFYVDEKLADERWRKQVSTLPLDQQLELEDELRRLDKEDQGYAELCGSNKELTRQG